jgi:hypothetical protein
MTGHAVEQSGFPRTALPHNAHDFTWIEIKGDIDTPDMDTIALA